MPPKIMNRRWLELIGYSKGNLKLEGLFTCDLNYFETLVSERGRESVRRREKGKDFWAPLEMGYRRATKTSNLTALSINVCIKSGKTSELSENYFSFWFRYKSSLFILLFLLPIFKIILGPHLSTARYIEAVLPAFNVFQSTPLWGKKLRSLLGLQVNGARWSYCSVKN